MQSNNIYIVELLSISLYFRSASSYLSSVNSLVQKCIKVIIKIRRADQLLMLAILSVAAILMVWGTPNVLAKLVEQAILDQHQLQQVSAKVCRFKLLLFTFLRFDIFNSWIVSHLHRTSQRQVFNIMFFIQYYCQHRN